MSRRILGWDVETTVMNIRLPQHRVERLSHILNYFMACKYTSRQKRQQLLSKLRGMALAIHSAKYLFSILQAQLQQQNTRRLKLRAITKVALQDWQDILCSLYATPVPIPLLVPHAPHYWAAVDASRDGLAGFWLPSATAGSTQPHVWLWKLPPSFTDCLTTATNPTGDLSVNGLESAAMVVGQHTMLQHMPPTTYFANCVATDNTSDLAWVTNGSPMMSGPPTLLLRSLATVNQAKTSTLHATATPGSTNTIADFLSRSFALSDTDLLTHLQCLVPIQPPWKLVTPTVNCISETNSALPKWRQPEKSQLTIADPIYVMENMVQVLPITCL